MCPSHAWAYFQLTTARQSVKPSRSLFLLFLMQPWGQTLGEGSPVNKRQSQNSDSALPGPEVPAEVHHHSAPCTASVPRLPASPGFIISRVRNACQGPGEPQVGSPSCRDLSRLGTEKKMSFCRGCIPKSGLPSPERVSLPGQQGVVAMAVAMATLMQAQALFPPEPS